MEFVRKHVGAIAGVAVGGMILWLVTSAVTAQSLARDIAGTLFKKPVPLANFVRAHQAVARQARMTHGEKYRDRVSEEELEQRAWERLVFLREAKLKRIRVSDREVVDEIASYPLFRNKDGSFDKAAYAHIVKYSFGANPRAFEEETRENMAISKLVAQVAGAVSVSDDDLHAAYRRKEETVRATVLAVPEEELAREIADAARQRPEWITQAAAQMGREALFTPLFNRGETLQELSVSGSLFDPVFDTQPGEIFPDPIYAPSRSEWLVVRLDEKQPADPSQMDEETEKALRASVEEQKRTRSYLEWYLELMKRADIKKAPASRR